MYILSYWHVLVEDNCNGILFDGKLATLQKRRVQKIHCTFHKLLKYYNRSIIIDFVLHIDVLHAAYICAL